MEILISTENGVGNTYKFIVYVYVYPIKKHTGNKPTDIQYIIDVRYFPKGIFPSGNFTLGNCHLGSRSWKNAFGKIPNIYSINNIQSYINDELYIKKIIVLNNEKFVYRGLVIFFNKLVFKTIELINKLKLRQLKN